MFLPAEALKGKDSDAPPLVAVVLSAEMDLVEPSDRGPRAKISGHRGGTPLPGLGLDSEQRLLLLEDDEVDLS